MFTTLTPIKPLRKKAYETIWQSEGWLNLTWCFNQRPTRRTHWLWRKHHSKLRHPTQHQNTMIWTNKHSQRQGVRIGFILQIETQLGLSRFWKSKKNIKINRVLSTNRSNWLENMPIFSSEMLTFQMNKPFANFIEGVSQISLWNRWEKAKWWAQTSYFPSRFICENRKSLSRKCTC